MCLGQYMENVALRVSHADKVIQYPSLFNVPPLCRLATDGGQCCEAVRCLALLRARSGLNNIEAKLTPEWWLVEKGNGLRGLALWPIKNRSHGSACKEVWGENQTSLKKLGSSRRGSSSGTHPPPIPGAELRTAPILDLAEPICVRDLFALTGCRVTSILAKGNRTCLSLTHAV